MTAADRSPVSTALYESCALLALNLVFGDTFGLSVPCHLPVACLGALVVAISPKGGQVTQGWLLKDLGVETGPNPRLAVSG